MNESVLKSTILQSLQKYARVFWTNNHKTLSNGNNNSANINKTIKIILAILSPERKSRLMKDSLEHQIELGSQNKVTLVWLPDREEHQEN